MTTIKNYFETDLQTDLLLKKTKKNAFEAVKLEKIILNAGVKDANTTSNKILPALLIMKLITHQQPIYTKARKSIANFKLREGKIIGCKTTLRNKNMYNFLEKIVHLVIPQQTEVKNYKYKNRRPNNSITFGVPDANIFPEMENQFELFNKITGLNITLCSLDKKLNKDNLIFSGFKIKFH
jgi:large subunit ribosomal protein L5